MEESKTDSIVFLHTIKEEIDEEETKISVENDPLYFDSQDEKQEDKVRKYIRMD